MQPPETGDDWLAIGDRPLPVDAAHDWVIRPGCGANVLFTGTVRDHADGRPGVVALSYEAHEQVAVAKLAEIASVARQRWTGIGAIALLHRVGDLAVGDVAVVAALSAPHREEAFAAASWAIDTLKRAVPIWKHETWADGADWGTDASEIAPVSLPR